MKRLYAILSCVFLLAVAASPAAAGANIGLKSVGLEIGFVSPEDVDATFGLTGVAHLGTFAPNFGLDAYASFWTKGETVVTGTDTNVRDIIVGGHARYIFPVKNPKVHPFAGAGLGVHFLHAEVTTPGFPTLSDSEVKVGFDVGGGLTAEINKQTNFIAEGWYTLVSDINQFWIRAGLMFNLP